LGIIGKEVIEMCGRFTLTASREALQDEFGIAFPEKTASYNIAPSQDVLSIVGHQEGMKAGFLKWGLVPSWAKDKKIGYKMINARAETLDEKPAFKRLLNRRRCLIVVDSFYEWKRENGKKKPYRITVGDGALFTFAGLWDRWRTNEEEIVSCTIITTKPNQMMSELHDRMPVILEEGNREAWLDQGIEDKDLLKSILQPYESEKMSAYEVSTLVNNPRNNGEELIARVL
jgi:putative SOS response-associated peptidase YedK